MADYYSFKKLLQELEGKSLAEIIQTIEDLHREISKITGKKAEETGSVQFAELLRMLNRFLLGGFWGTNIKQLNQIIIQEFLQVRPLIEELVEKGQQPPDQLKLLDAWENQLKD